VRIPKAKVLQSNNYSMMTLMPAMMIKMMMKIVGKNQKERPPEMQRYSMGKWLTFWEQGISWEIISIKLF